MHVIEQPTDHAIVSRFVMVSHVVVLRSLRASRRPDMLDKNLDMLLRNLCIWICQWVTLTLTPVSEGRPKLGRHCFAHFHLPLISYPNEPVEGLTSLHLKVTIFCSLRWVRDPTVPAHGEPFPRDLQAVFIHGFRALWRKGEVTEGCFIIRNFHGLGAR